MSALRKLALSAVTVCGVVVYLGYERMTHPTTETPPTVNPSLAPSVPPPDQAKPPEPPPDQARPPEPPPAQAQPPGPEPSIAVLSTGLPMKADREGEFHGCKDGTLVFAQSEIVFTCDTNLKRSVTLKAEDIQETDGNGVRQGKDKYHFNIHGMDRKAGEELFANWLKQVKNVSSSASN